MVHTNTKNWSQRSVHFQQHTLSNSHPVLVKRLGVDFVFTPSQSQQTHKKRYLLACQEAYVGYATLIQHNLMKYIVGKPNPIPLPFRTPKNYISSTFCNGKDFDQKQDVLKLGTFLLHPPIFTIHPSPFISLIEEYGVRHYRNPSCSPSFVFTFPLLFWNNVLASKSHKQYNYIKIFFLGGTMPNYRHRELSA